MSDTQESIELPYRNSFGLTNQQEAFAQAVIVEKTYSDAYRSAYDCSGMTDKTVHEEASKLNVHPKVSPRVQELRDRAEKRADVTLDRWFREQSRIAYSDPKELYDDNGDLKDLSEMTPEARATIAELVVEYPNGEDAPVKIVKLKQWSKTQAQESLGRALGAYEKDNNQKRDIYVKADEVPNWIDEPKPTTD